MPATAVSIGPGGVVLLVLTVICWFIFAGCLFGTVGQEVHGDAAVGQAFGWLAAILFAALTWLWLGGLLLKAGTQDRIPGWAATLVYLGCAGATVAALILLQDPQRIWPVVIPVLLPPILAFYVFALYQPSLGPYFVSPAGKSVIGTALAILCLAPWPALFQKLGRDDERRRERAAAQEEWTRQERARNRADNLVKLSAMKPDEPLVNWYPLLDEQSGVRPEALAALRHVERRQADIEEMLSYTIPAAMALLPELDLEPTPQLCDAAKGFMLASAKRSRVRSKQDPVVYSAGELEKSLPGIRWLMAHGCNCDEGIAALEASVESHLDSPDRKAALASLAALREKRSP